MRYFSDYRQIVLFIFTSLTSTDLENGDSEFKLNSTLLCLMRQIEIFSKELFDSSFYGYEGRNVFSFFLMYFESYVIEFS